MKSILFILFSLLLLTVGYSCEEKKDIHFYCRVCGAIIANYSSIIEKDADRVDSVSDLLGQEKGVQIQYDSFESSNIWKDKKLVYFSKASEDVVITQDRHLCTHFPDQYYSQLTCSHCKSHIGFFIEELSEEEEDDLPIESQTYGEEDIIDMLNIIPDGIEMQLKEFFLSIAEPTLSLGFWSYKYKHRKIIEQYHNKVKGNPNDQDLNWSLGEYNEERSGFYGIDLSTSSPTPYYSYYFTNGQMCDEIKAPRETEVRFEPCENTQKGSIRSVDETSICRYIIRICVPSLTKKGSTVHRNGFYALSLDDVIPSSDRKLIEIFEQDSFGNSLTNSSVLNNKHTHH